MLFQKSWYRNHNYYTFNNNVSWFIVTYTVRTPVTSILIFVHRFEETTETRKRLPVTQYTTMNCD